MVTENERCKNIKDASSTLQSICFVAPLAFSNRVCLSTAPLSKESLVAAQQGKSPNKSFSDIDLSRLAALSLSTFLANDDNAELLE